MASARSEKDGGGGGGWGWGWGASLGKSEGTGIAEVLLQLWHSPRFGVLACEEIASRLLEGL